MGRKSPNPSESRVLPGGGQQPRGVAPTEAPDAGTAGELGGLAECLAKIYGISSDPWKIMKIYGISRYFWWSMFFLVDIGDESWILYIYIYAYIYIYMYIP